MRLKFSKMQGAGNDFVVIDATRQPVSLTAAQLRHLGDRRFGVGADQILVVEPSPAPGIDFLYRIFNNDGGEVEQCGNGARCFARFVHDQGLSPKTRIRVQTLSGVIEPELQADGRVTVDMGAPVFEPTQVPFSPQGLTAQAAGNWHTWSLPLPDPTGQLGSPEQVTVASVAVLSMGNPHAVQVVNHVEQAPVSSWGPLIEHHPAFPKRVNAGFMQILSRQHISLRVFERGAGETLACGTGACAAVVAGIRLGHLDAQVDVDTRGGQLRIEWQGPGHSVKMTGPAITVFEGEIEID
jgi:diaminopimelate epimerase